MTIDECWQLFCTTNPKFIYYYAAYHYYRGSGWCVKSGLKYGTDYVLYRKGPTYFHAEHAVIIETASEFYKIETEILRPVSWITLLNQNRVSEQVSKGLIICYVLYDNNSQTDLLSSPTCLQYFKIQELTIGRWVPERTRA